MDKVKPSPTGRPADVASRPAGLGSSTDVLLDPTGAPGLLHRPLREVEPRAPGEEAGSRGRARPEEAGGAAGKGGSWQGPLHTAAQKGHEQIVRLLLQHATECDDRDGDGMTPLFYAIKGGFEGIATALLDSGARIHLADDQQRNVLHLAVVERRASMLVLLLERSDGDEDLIESYDAAGMTPLHVAADIGFLGRGIPAFDVEADHQGHAPRNRN